jgi:hypothetical protein
MSNRRAYLTAKKRESRQRARDDGRCIICTTNPADEHLVTCAECRRGVSTTRRTYNAWIADVRTRATALAGDDLDLQHHQPADRMVEFIVRSGSDPLNRGRRLRPSYDWRDTDPARVVDDVVAAHRELRADVPSSLAPV